MYSILAVIVLGVGAVWYFIRIGKNLEKASGLKAALGIHGKINREKDKIETKHRKNLAKKSRGNPRDFFNN
jgi:hypothetical protein